MAMELPLNLPSRGCRSRENERLRPSVLSTSVSRFRRFFLLFRRADGGMEVCPDLQLPLYIMWNCTSSLVHWSSARAHLQALPSDCRSARKELQRRALRILELGISFVRNRAFAKMKPEAAAFPKESLLVEEDEDPFRRTPLSPLFRSPLLRPEGERTLFRKMNFCKYRALRLRSQLNPRRPAKRLVDQIETLLRTAERCRSQLVESNLRLVGAIARGFRNSNLDVEELVSEGNVVLLNAVEKFDFSRGFRFSTYATHAIRRHLYRRILRDQRRIQQEHGVEPRPLQLRPVVVIRWEHRFRSKTFEIGLANCPLGIKPSSSPATGWTVKSGKRSRS